MTRPSPLGRGAGRVAAATFVVLSIAVLAGCASAPGLTDPREILTKSAEAMSSVRTVHFHATAVGQMVVGLEPAAESPSVGASEPAPSDSPSSGPSEPPPSPVPSAVSTAIPLDNTYADGDVDYETQSATVTGRAPGLPNTAGQLIVVGDDAFLRTPDEPAYRHVPSSDLLFNPANPADAPVIVQGVLQIASDSRSAPSLAGTESCPDGGCYHVTVSISRDVAGETIGEGGMALGGGTIDVWILTSSYRVARIEFTSTDPAAGAIKARLELSRYDRALTIQAPPPGQVVERS